MRLWEYLKSKMERYADRIAFANSGLTYKDLLNLSESVEQERRFVLRGFLQVDFLSVTKKQGLFACN